ncbi:MAG: hypothetical protein HY726_09040 [Candidatus Rokubacteria bacterium]|nr:hypothetical protein [Candidatus Rokubacteria bacterium]
MLDCGLRLLGNFAEHVLENSQMNLGPTVHGFTRPGAPLHTGTSRALCLRQLFKRAPPRGSHLAERPLKGRPCLWRCLPQRPFERDLRGR